MLETRINSLSTCARRATICSNLRYSTTLKEQQTMFRLLTLLILLLPFTSIADPAPSFNCAKAASETEKTICANPELSALDSKMAIAYKNFIAQLSTDQRSTALRLQRLWIKNRQAGCDEHQPLVDCLLESYKTWLTAINNQTLLVIIPLQVDMLFQDPFSEHIQWKLEKNSDKKEDDKEYELNEHFYLYSINKGKKIVIEEGSLAKYSSIDYESTLPTHLYYYLTVTGVRYQAYLVTKEGSGGRCYSELVKTLKFLGKSISKSFGEVLLLEGDYACDTYEKSVRNWKTNENGELEFYFVDFESFYQQTPFVEIIQTRVNAKTETLKTLAFLDESITTFEGKPYNQIMESLTKTVVNVSPTIEKTNNYYDLNQLQTEEKSLAKSDSCTEVIPNYYAYIALKESLMNHFIGFKQLQFMAFNVLKREDLVVGKPYKPLIEKTLLYLKKIKETPEWQEKLLNAAKKFPEIQATANYYYEFDMPFESNPFEDAGFYSDKSCYAMARSPLHHASLEEWIYLFWARRVKDESLGVTEKLLEEALLLID